MAVIGPDNGHAEAHERIDHAEGNSGAPTLSRKPSVAATARPINPNVPEALAAADKKWNRYFLFEPNLHFGCRF